MMVDVQGMRDVVARVAQLTGFAIGGADSGDVAVAGVGRVGVTSVVAVLKAGGIEAREWAPAGGRAALAILVLDPSSGVADAEADLLEQLHRDASMVAIVCNKIDAYWDWPTLLKANRALLDPHGRLPIFAVSAAAALAGHHAESGFAELLAWLKEQLAPAARPERLATAVAERELGELIDTLASRDRDDPAAGLLAERAAVIGARDRGRLDRLAGLRGGAGQIRGAVVAELNAGARTLSNEAAARAAELPRSAADAFADWLSVQLDGLRARTHRRIADEVNALEARTMLGLEESDAAGPPGPPAASPLPPRPPARRGAEEILLVVFGASAGLGLGRLVVTPMAAVDTLQWISMPLTLVVGVAIAVGLVRLRRLSNLRTATGSWAQNAITDSRSAVEQEVSRQLHTAESVIGGRLTRHYERRSHLATDRVAELDRQIRERRRAATADHQDDLARLSAAVDVRDRIEKILGELEL